MGEVGGAACVDEGQDRLQHLRLCPAIPVPPALAIFVVAAAAREGKGPKVHDATAGRGREQRGAERRATCVEDGEMGRVARAPQDGGGVGSEGGGKQAGQVVAQARFVAQARLALFL